MARPDIVSRALILSNDLNRLLENSAPGQAKLVELHADSVQNWWTLGAGCGAAPVLNNASKGVIARHDTLRITNF